MRFWIIVCCAGLCLFLAACNEEKKQVSQAGALPPPLVSVQKMKRADVPLYAVFMGQTAGSLSAAVKPQVTGILQERLFDEGARVERGDALFRIDPAPFKAALEQAEGQLASARSTLENARRENLRVQRLYKSNAVSQQESDNARTSLLNAQAEVRSARAAVEEARIRLGYTEVTSPLSGWTSRAVSTVGSLVNPENILTYVSQNDPMEVHFAVPSAEISAMRDMEAKGRARSYGLGSQVYLRLLEGAGYALPGKVFFLDTQVDASTSAILAKASLPNPQGLLMPGQFAAVHVTGASLLQALMLPQEAVMQTASGPAVYVLDSENRAVHKDVALGPAFGAEFLVERGLDDGDLVIVQGQDKVRPGQKVSLRMIDADSRGGGGKSRSLESPWSSPVIESRGRVEDAPAPVLESPVDSSRSEKEKTHE